MLVRIRSLVLISCLLSLAHSKPALAAWSSDGNAVATNTSEEITNYGTQQWGQGELVCPDSTGGLICAFLRGTSLFVNRLDAVSATRLWNTGTGNDVTAGGTATGSVRVAADGLGGAWIVWEGTGASGNGIYAQLYNAAGTRQLASGGVFIDHPVSDLSEISFGVAATPSGKLLVAYTGPDSLDVVRLSRSGSVDWSRGAGLTGSLDFNPNALVADGEGAVVAWLQTQTFTSGTSTRSHLAVKVNRISLGGATLWSPNGKRVFGDFNHLFGSVNTAWDGATLFMVVQRQTAPSGSGHEVVAQRLDANGNEMWTVGGVLVRPGFFGGPAAQINPFPRIVLDSSGGCILGWVDGRDFNRLYGSTTNIHKEDVYAQRLSSTGVAQWTANGVPVDTTGDSQWKMRMVPDGQGGATFVYEDNLPGSLEADIRARHLNAAGAQLTSVALNDNFPIDTRQEDPSAAPDGRGGIVAAWTDHESDATQMANVRATHRNASLGLFTASLTVLSPNGGESFHSLEPIPITWTGNFGGGNVKLEYRDAGGAPVTIAASTPNDGSFSWDASFALDSNQLEVIVSEADDGLPTDSSNSVFSVCSTLATSVSSAGEAVPSDMVIEDFNEDGIPDVAVAYTTGVRIQVGLGSAGVGNGQYAFSLSLALSGGGRAIVTRDFNEDGIQDLAVTHSDRVAILLGTGASGVGNGGFTVGSDIPLGTQAGGLAVADLNDDGVDDLVVAAMASDSVDVLFGQGTNGIGNGTLAFSSRFRVRNQPQRLAVGDFNEDGIWDLAVTCNDASPSVSVLLGTGANTVGTGSFSAAVHYTVGAQPFDVETGDFNEDGISDLAVANVADGDVSVLMGQGSAGKGNGTFGAKTDYPVTLFTNFLDVADLDGDGRADLVASATLNHTLDVLFGDGVADVGDGTFTRADDVLGAGNHPVGLTAMDAIEDGVPEVMFATEGLVGGWKGSCPTSLSTALQVYGMARVVVGEILPIFVTRPLGVMSVHLQVSYDNGANWRTVAENLTEATFSWRADTPSSNARFRVFDPTVPSRLAVSSPFPVCDLPAPSSSQGVHDGPTTVTTADMDHDGLLDVLMAINGGAQILHNAGASAWDTLASVPVAGSARAVAAGDFTGDGVLDLAITTSSGLSVARQITAGLTPTLTFAPATTLLSGSNCNGIAVADFDEDGIADLALAVTSLNQLRVFRGNGTSGSGNGTFSANGTYAVGTTPLFLQVFDFNEDGIADIAVTNNAVASSSLSVLLGQGTGGKGDGLFAAPVNVATVTQPRAIVVADFDEDGIADLATGSISSGGIGIHFGNGSGGVGDGSFGAAVVAPVSGSVRDLAVVDEDGSGSADLVASMGSDGTLQFLYNGRGTEVGVLTPGAALDVGGFATAALINDFGTSGQRRGLAFQFDLDAVVPFATGCPLSLAYYLLAPNGGENWPVGSEQTIHALWDGVAVGNDIEVSRDNGVSWQRIASNVRSTTYVWTVTPPGTATARVRVVNAQRFSNRVQSANPFMISGGGQVGVEDVPLRADFSVAWPNPSSGRVRFDLALPRGATVDVAIFDLAGRRIAELARGPFAAGKHGLIWDGRTDDGAPSGPGVYFVKARWPGFEQVRRVVRMN